MLEHLRQLSPAHGNALKSYGTRLGWWNTIAYLRTTGMGTKEVAEKLIQKPIKQKSDS